MIFLWRPFGVFLLTDCIEWFDFDTWRTTKLSYTPSDDWRVRGYL